jgi:hypothetical protein
MHRLVSQASSEIRTEDEDDYLDGVADERDDEEGQDMDAEVGEEDEKADRTAAEDLASPEKSRKRVSLKLPKPRAKLDSVRYI